MLGVRTSQVFTSRWKALLWSAGVLLTAYCTIPAADNGANPPPSAKHDQASQEQQQAREIIANLDNLKAN